MAETEKVLPQPSLLLRSLENVFHIIAMIIAFSELFFLSDRSDHMETRLKCQRAKILLIRVRCPICLEFHELP